MVPWRPCLIGRSAQLADAGGVLGGTTTRQIGTAASLFWVALPETGRCGRVWESLIQSSDPVVVSRAPTRTLTFTAYRNFSVPSLYFLFPISQDTTSATEHGQCCLPEPRTAHFVGREHLLTDWQS